MSLSGFLTLPSADTPQQSSPEYRAYGPLGIRRTSNASLWYGTGQRAGAICALLGGYYDKSALANRLGMPASLSSSELLWEAYGAEGLDFLNRIQGQFAMALWDPARERLILGRDHVGERPLLYHQGTSRLHFACSLSDLFAQPGVPRALDENQLAKHILMTELERDALCWRGIKRVRPGHVLIAEKGHVTSYRYWRPEETPRLQLPKDADYPEALREALELSVARRLPAEGTVATELSAGMDSTTVTALAAHQLAQQGRPLIALTSTPRQGFQWPGSGSPRLVNEAPLASLVAARHPNIQHILIPGDSRPLISSMAYFNRLMATPTYAGPNATWLHALHDTAAQHQAKVLLTGKSGNSTSSYSGMNLLPSLFHQGKLSGLPKQIHGLRQQGMPWITIASQLLGTWVPGGLRRPLRTLAGKPRELQAMDVIYIRPEFAAACESQSAMTDDVVWARAMRHDGRAIRAQAFRIKDDGLWTSNMAQQHGFWMSDALSDKALVELCFAIPEEQYLYNGQPRALIRRAMADLLPPQILNNPLKGQQSADLLWTLMDNLGQILAELDLMEANDLARRALDLPRIRQMLVHLPAVIAQPTLEQHYKYYGLTRALAAGMFMVHAESIV